jgi:outer membrane protein TolC
MPSTIDRSRSISRRSGGDRTNRAAAMMRFLFAGFFLVASAATAGAQRAAPLSLSLQEALARADLASPAVGIARAGITGAQASWLRARSSYLPQLNGSATYTRTLQSEFSAFAATTQDTFPAPVNCHHFVPNPSLPLADRLDSLEHAVDCTANGSIFSLANLPFGQANTWNFGVSGSLTLFDRKIAGQMATADAGRQQASIEVDAQRAAAVVNVAQAYFDAQLAQRLVDIADSTLAQAQRTFDQTRLERQVGNAAEFDQLRAGVARDNQSPVVIQRRAERDQAFLRLRQVLDLAAATPLILTTPLIDTAAAPLPAYAARIAAANDTAIDARAPVREAQAAVFAGDGQVRTARAERLPAIVLSSTYAKIDFPQNVFSFNRFLTDWSVNVQLTVPIYDGGRLHADVLAAEATRDQSAMRLKQARQQAQLEQGDARTQLESAQAAWTASLGTSAQAQRAYDIAELRYSNGLSTLTEVADVRLQLGQAEANSAQAARDLQVARIRLSLLRDLPFGAGTAAGTSAATGAGAPAASSTTPVNPANPATTTARPAGTGVPTGGS